jgi:RNA polymerase subunit RPABC4/transcription elongation factor Spt4
MQRGGRMGKVSIICPHCNSQKLEIQFDEKKGKGIEKVKDGKFDNILTQVDDSHWTDNPEDGVSVTCKCGGHSIVYGIYRGLEAIRIANEVEDNQLIGGFCRNCRSGFLAKKHVCPTCNTTV